MHDRQEFAVMKLFKSYVSDKPNEPQKINIYTESINSYIVYTGWTKPSDEVINLAQLIYGRSAEEMNKSFHKNFNIVAESDMQYLVASQLLHYFSTYGLEVLNILNSESNNQYVYIPTENLQLPPMDEKVSLLIIKNITQEELTKKLMDLLTSDIALSQATIDSIIDLSEYIPKNHIEQIKNRQVKTAMYEYYKIVPEDPLEFLRYLVFSLTKQTLLIKNKSLIVKLRGCDREKCLDLLKRYLEPEEGVSRYPQLASIYWRYKDLFLALKDTNITDIKKTKDTKKINTIMNRLDRYSVKYYRSIGLSKLDKVSDISTNITEKDLQNVSIFRLVRLYNVINHKLNTKIDCRMFNIRNGMTYIKQEGYKYLTQRQKYSLEWKKSLIYNEIVKRIKPNIENKTVYIPEEINYCVPQSEKLFVGNIPQGSYIKVSTKHNLVTAIKWNNIDKENQKIRVDLDLKLINNDCEYGWNASYRDKERTVLFSGDMTDAQNGAVEAYLLKPYEKRQSFLLTVNDYRDTYDSCGVRPEYHFVIVDESNTNIENNNYIIDPNKIVVDIPMQIGEKAQSAIAVLVTEENNSKIYLYDKIFSNRGISYRDNKTLQAYECLLDKADCSLMLSQLLKDCGANILTKEQYEHYQDTSTIDFNLSYDSLDKNTIIKMLS